MRPTTSYADGTTELRQPVVPQGRYLLTLSLVALGVVYGDIGTSPLYAMRESFLPEHGVAVTPGHVLGVLSLIFWALVLVVSIKYLAFILLADNQGEGGILALTALLLPAKSDPVDRHRRLILCGLFGAALIYGDGMITPAISVLSAVEGLRIATPFFDPYIVPITIAILVGLFWIQSRGTASVGRVFGPVTLVWFLTLSALGLANIWHAPGVLAAINPAYAWGFALANGWHAFLVLGSVFLVVTGGEALYADMGHFGRRPMRFAWFSVVLPALLLNYFGQGALLTINPATIENPFYLMVPAWALYPAVFIATAATIIASQAMISGAFSLTMQAIQLGYLPRVQIEHTSAEEAGQIYVPSVNWTLMVACVGLVLGFKTSSNMAAAYGFAVSTTMVMTTVLFAFIVRERWQWSLPKTAAIAGGFLAIDLSFFAANALKIPAGGWFPLLIGAAIFALLTTWKRGRTLLAARIAMRVQPLDDFLRQIHERPPLRVPGTAVFMYSQPGGTPPALLHNLRHNGVLHEQVVLLSVTTKRVPFVGPAERALVKDLGEGICQIVLRYGFMESAHIPKALAAIGRVDLALDPARLSYFLGRETVLATEHPGMALWREHLFALMTRNTTSANAFFFLPPDQVVELGSQVEI